MPSRIEELEEELKIRDNTPPWTIREVRVDTLFQLLANGIEAECHEWSLIETIRKVFPYLADEAEERLYKHQYERTK